MIFYLDSVCLSIFSAGLLPIHGIARQGGAIGSNSGRSILDFLIEGFKIGTQNKITGIEAIAFGTAVYYAPVVSENAMAPIRSSRTTSATMSNDKPNSSHMTDIARIKS